MDSLKRIELIQALQATLGADALASLPGWAKRRLIETLTGQPASVIACEAHDPLAIALASLIDEDAPPRNGDPELRNEWKRRDAKSNYHYRKR